LNCALLASKSQLVQRQNQYVILGVTGPNEYENNINNNFYTNYIAKWCIDYTYEQIQKKYRWNTRQTINASLKKWQMLNFKNGKSSRQYVLPVSKELGVYLQQDGFLDKDLVPVKI
jgi:maltose phosphorylase